MPRLIRLSRSQSMTRMCIDLPSIHAIIKAAARTGYRARESDSLDHRPHQPCWSLPRCDCFPRYSRFQPSAPATTGSATYCQGAQVNQWGFAEPMISPWMVFPRRIQTHHVYGERGDFSVNSPLHGEQVSRMASLV